MAIKKYEYLKRVSLQIFQSILVKRNAVGERLYKAGDDDIDQQLNYQNKV